ncbi:hypothetical protein Lalb_Chr14g0375541 [Lupinus albus]|uniref:Uncharacterized protein n=1 Tax=Lupinus albus TaxID=3870 RepID=A0A6A4PGS8_LUPAL|nr:hypothetical protein Lalb_Chr14g0375541 [Lupinus albus]
MKSVWGIGEVGLEGTNFFFEVSTCNTNFWSKRSSLFGSFGKPMVFLFRYYRGMKSSFFRRRGFFPLSESSVRFVGGGSSSRRSKSIASPMFMRSSGLTAGVSAFSSSMLRLVGSWRDLTEDDSRKVKRKELS